MGVLSGSVAPRVSWIPLFLLVGTGKNLKYIIRGF